MYRHGTWHRTANTKGSNREKQTLTAGDIDEATMQYSKYFRKYTKVRLF